MILDVVHSQEHAQLDLLNQFDGRLWEVGGALTRAEMQGVRVVVCWAWLIKWGDANPCKKRVWSPRVAGLPTPGECGHPEWLDFPHQGSVVIQSGWTSHTRELADR